MLRQKLLSLLLLFVGLTCLGQESPKPTPQWRPVYHFSPPKNWTNDPNGLIYLNGEYKLYYQHNPFENRWGHMSWGHAASKDLVHWNNLPVAMPEIVTTDTTTYMYSGCIVSDKNNTSGLGVNGTAPLVAIYTADLPKQHKEMQNIAYSNDGGLHFIQYNGNPVIDLNMRDFRDPNVFWYEPAKKWIMTVSMVNQHQIRIYGSKNLKEWTKLSDFGPAGYTKRGWECPSLLPLMVDNDPAKIKWVLFVSSGGDHGPLMQYFVGDFDGTTFSNVNARDKELIVDYGDAFYAAIAWRNAPQDKKILLGWLQSGRVETYPWKGQMSIPRDLSLKTTANGLALLQNPNSGIVNNLAKLSKNKVMIKRNLQVNGDMSLSDISHFNNNSDWIEADFKVEKSARFGFIVAHNKTLSKKIAIGYDTEKQQLYVDCTASENANKDKLNLIQSAPLKPENGIIKLRILLDKSSLEVFGNNGERVISTMIYPDNDATGLSVFSSGKTIIKTLKVWNME